MHAHRLLRRGWLGAAALLLAGCGALPQAPRPFTRYDLGTAPVAVPALAGPARPAIALAPLQAPLQRDGDTAMYYRLAYADAQVLNAYSLARWTTPPAQLVQQRLAQYLERGERVVLPAGVGESLPTVQGQRVPVLRWSLEEFSQVFHTQQDSHGVIRLRATLVDPRPQGDVLLAQKVFVVQQAAAAPSAPAGVRALVQGVDTLGQQLVQWLDGVLQNPR